MRIAVISDIHANRYALQAVLAQIKQEGIAKLIVLGDIFGYYPWAPETYEMLKPLDMVAVKGNHDDLILNQDVPHPKPVYWQAAKHNEAQLRHSCPEALAWLQQLSYEHKFKEGSWAFHLVHGHPGDPCCGRYYPDDEKIYPWLPGNNEVLLLGHTHYPMLKKFSSGGVAINPGSVGQPRDGITESSWCIINTDCMDVSFRRTPYPCAQAIEELSQMKWEPQFIRMLSKCKTSS